MRAMIKRPLFRDPYLPWALLLALLALSLRVCSIAANLPDVPNPDEYMLIWPPLRMAYGTWTATGGYPPLYAYLLLVEYGVFYGLGALAGQFGGPMDFARQMLSDPTPLYLMGRTTSVLLGTATVLWLYAVGRRLYDGRVGLLAAAFLAFDTVHVYASQVVKNDVLMVFLLVGSFWFAVGILEQGRKRDYALAGLLAGLATAAKYNGVLAVLPIIAAHILQSRARHVPLRKSLLAIPFWLAGLCTAGGFLLGYPHFLLNIGLALEGLRANSVDFFWDWLGWEGAAVGWIYYPFIALRTAWGIPLQVLALTGLAGAFFRRRSADVLLVIIPLSNYLLIGSVRVNQPRYFLLATPFLLLLAARLLVDLLERARLRPAFATLVAALFLAWPAAFTIFQDGMLLQPNPRVQAREWIEAHVPSGSRIVLDTAGPALVASPESSLVFDGPPQGRFEELQREIATAHTPNYWIWPIRHFIRGQDYRARREATVLSLDEYRAEEYELIVTSDLVYNSYRRWPGVAERYPRTMAFYDQVSREAELLAEFRPVWRDPRDFTTTDLMPVPTIRIYRLPQVQP